MDDRISVNLLPGLLTWICAYISDYWLTLVCARMYRAGVNKTLAFEGSYELTPYYQSDIDSLRRFSPRFFLILILSVLALWSAFLMRGEGSFTNLYPILLGSLISVEVPVHIRHFRNYCMFRDLLAEKDQVRGRIEYSRGFILRMSAVELFAFSFFFFALAVLAQSWALFGGSIACCAVAYKHRRLAQTPSASPPSKID